MLFPIKKQICKSKIIKMIKNGLLAKMQCQTNLRLKWIKWMNRINKECNNLTFKDKKRGQRDKIK